MYALDKRYLRHTDKIFHRIYLKKNFKPVKLRPYPLSIRDKVDLEGQIKELLEINIIRRTTSSEWSSPVLLVNKIDSISKRLVLDARGLNEMTVSEIFFNPTINEIMSSLHGSKIFSCLDLANSYWQLPIHPSETHVTSFATHIGHFEYLYAPFGLNFFSVTLGRLLTS